MPIKWVSEKEFEFEVYDGEDNPVGKRMGTVRGMTQKHEDKWNWTVKQFAPEFESTIYKTGLDDLREKVDQKKYRECLHSLIRIQNPLLTDGDLSDLTFGEVLGIISKMLGITMDPGYSAKGLSFLPASPDPNTESGTAGSAENSSSAQSVTATDK